MMHSDQIADNPTSQDAYKPLIAENERQRRQQVVAFHQNNLRLDGIEVSEAIRALHSRYVEGALDNNAFQTACLEFAWSIAKNHWRPGLATARQRP